VKTLAIAVAALVTVGCAKQRGDDERCVAIESGTEKGACYGNGTCNDGLMCLSELCVPINSLRLGLARVYDRIVSLLR
jgi:hypothetical protein